MKNKKKKQQNHGDNDMQSMDHTQMNMESSGGDMMQHGGQMMHMGNMKRKFWVSLIFSLPIIALSPMLKFSFMPNLAFPGSEWLVLILATFLYIYGGAPFIKGAKAELKERKPEMMTLVALGITVSYFYSLYAFTINQFFVADTHVMDFFWELATLIDIMLLGHWIEMDAVMAAGNALEKMAALLPNTATIVADNGDHIEKPLNEVVIGESVIVKAGEKIPTDGIILDGNTTVNEALVTGESKAVTKMKNDKVIGGSTNGSGAIMVKVTGTGQSGYLAQVMQMVSNAQKEQSKAEGVADKVAGLLVYAAVSAAILTFIVWLLVSGDFNLALERTVTVLVIACPHALGLAIPLVVARSTSIGAQNGLLTRKRQALEDATELDAILMDKTGTLTEGNFAVNDYKATDTAYSNEQIISLMGALESGSSHPLSVGILSKLKELNLKTIKAKNIQNLPGVGIQGEINKKNMTIVNEKYLRENKIKYDKKTASKLASAGNTVSFLLVANINVGFVAQGDQIKPASIALINGLKAQHIRPVMLTGDNQQVAQQVAERLGINQQDVHAELKPDDKEKIVKQYQDKGLKVAMVGDGVNDAPSLVRANVGIAIGAGTDVAVDSADIILVRSDPADILNFLKLAKHTTRKMVQNLWFGAGYNIFAIPLAAGVLAFAGIVLSPALGAVLMGLSTIIVAINAQTLRIGK